MKVTATLRCVKTGEVRSRVDDVQIADLGGHLFWWTDGNFGCDCNRRRAFVREHPSNSNENHDALLSEQLRAEGLPVEMEPYTDGTEEVDSPCGRDAFELLSLVTADGQDLLKEEKS